MSISQYFRKKITSSFNIFGNFNIKVILRHNRFIKDVSLEKAEDELLLREVDEMTDIKYEKESSFLEGMDAKAREMAKKLKNKGVDVNIIAESSGLSRADVMTL